MILSIGWKNIWRNKLRSIIIILTIAFGLAGTVFTIGLAEGMLDSRNQKVIETQYGHIQIHHPHFTDKFNIKDTIANLAYVKSVLDTISFVSDYTDRLLSVSMISSAYNSTGGFVVGINPQQDKKVIKLQKYLIAGKYLDQVKRRNAILIGKELAKKLQLVSFKITDSVYQDLLNNSTVPQETIEKLKPIIGQYFHTSSLFYKALDTILDNQEFVKYADIIADRSMVTKLRRKVIIRVRSMNGEVVEEAFKVVGIFYTNNLIFDLGYVFVKKDVLAQMIGVSNSTANEIIILTDDVEKSKKYAKILSNYFPQLKVRSIYEIDPYLMFGRTVMKLYYLIGVIIVLFALSFGIVNTMLMAVLERTKELGMLMAIGMNKWRVFKMIMYESTLLTFTGGVLGIILGEALVLYYGKFGINIYKFAERGMNQLGFDTLVYPQVPFIVILGVAVLVVLTGIAAAIYPALKALSLKPVEALRTEV